jgi:hypothetical protein
MIIFIYSYFPMLILNDCCQSSSDAHTVTEPTEPRLDNAGRRNKRHGGRNFSHEGLVSAPLLSTSEYFYSALVLGQVERLY